MKYKEGDRVRIKSLDWYTSNKNRIGEVWTKSLGGKYKICFDRDMIRYCGMETVIFSVERENYVLQGIPYAWTDEMIEGLVEEAILIEKDYNEFVALVKKMRKAQKRQEYTDSTLDREAMNECRKLTKQRESEVDEYLKKMEEEK